MAYQETVGRKRAAIILHFREGKKNAEIVKLLKKSKVTFSMVARTIKRYKDTGSTKERQRAGRPRSKRTPAMLAALEDGVRQDPRRSQRKLAVQMNASVGTIRRALRRDLGLGTYHMLAVAQKKALVANPPDIENQAVTNFREYLRIPSVHPNPDYVSCIEWLRNQATEIGLEFNILQFPPPNLFTVWLTWPGTSSQLSSILLNSHMDVVPVEANEWKHDPFGAHKDEAGNIYARGSQDMKCVGVQYLESIRRLKQKGFRPLRTVHVSFVPDEELGGVRGMKYFVTTPEFLNLNIGFALDEGIASPTEEFVLSYGERTIWQVKFCARGKGGHASTMFENTAAEKIQKIINSMLQLRSAEKRKLDRNLHLGLGDVSSINMTLMQGGQEANVVPSQLSVTFDMRIAPQWSLDDVAEKLDKICAEAGKGVSYSFLIKDIAVKPTAIDDGNIWWTTFKSVFDDLDLKLKPQIFQGTTDVRFLRQLGISGLGFSPMNNTPVLLHDHEEFLNESTFLRGIDIYESILERITYV